MTKLTTISLTLTTFAAAAYAGDAKQDAKPAPAPAMEMPKPSKEVTDMGKAMTGTWKCTGTALMGPGNMADVKGTATIKTDLDGFYIQNTVSIGAGKMIYKFHDYTAFDGKKWHRYGVDNMNGAREAESTGPGGDGKIVWEGQGSQMGKVMKFKDTEEMGKDKSFHTVGEVSMDGGKTWTKEHDITCKK